MSNPPSWGRDTKGEASGLPMDENRIHDALRSGDVGEARKTRRLLPKPKSQSSSQKAITDAQQGLHSLLNPQTDSKHPNVISPSGAVRGQKRGRIAGPSNDDSSEKNPNRRAPLLEGDLSSRDTGLSVRPAGPEGREIKAVPQTRIGAGVARATGTLQTARENARLLINSTEESAGGLSAAPQNPHTQRRAAQWATRYATHLVVLMVVVALVVLGGLKSFTVQGAYIRGLAVASSNTGTDAFDDGLTSQNGKPDHDSNDFSLTLPRTELSTAPQQPGASGAPQQPGAAGKAAVGTVTKYVVARGDSIQSIADKFNVMPETVMGSNGIFDLEEALAPGRVLMVPPIDGMYYVVTPGDTLESVANRFQVDPSDLFQYPGNKIDKSGALQAGQALVVPGGMMPARENTLAYTVRKGDTLKGIAARFGVDVPTMLNSNKIPDPDNLQPGSQLRVLPVPGMEYAVQKGDTILKIADSLGVSPQMILDYSPNGLTVDSKLQVGQVIMVPGGSPPQVVVAQAERVAPRDQPSARGAARPPVRQESRIEPPQRENPPPQPQPQPQPQAQPTPTPQPKSGPKPVATPTPKPKVQPKPNTSTDNSPKAGTGRFMWPVNGTITQYFTSYHNGLDIAISAGTSIHAADAGRVIWSGWRTDGLGYCVMIDHLDGYTTVYGHMIRQPSVYVGQYVDRGQVIGYVGSTGHSTGPHVHFMVKAGGGTSHNYRNPLAYLSR